MGMTLDDARVAARRAWALEIESRVERDVLLSAVKKVKRALDDKDRQGLEIEHLPRLSQAESEAMKGDMAWHEENTSAGKVASLHLRLRHWVEAFDVTRSLRGVGRPEWVPGLSAAAFVLCDWHFKTRGSPPRAMLYSKRDKADVDDWDAREDGVAYDPSEDVKWLAAELVLLEPGLDNTDDAGRPLSLHQADNFIEMWRDARGFRRPRDIASSGISGTD